jgi:D-serine deaminase-like pyridoxal phosphate-dependent protein
VLVAYPVVSANARRVRELAEQFPRVRVSVLVEDEMHVQQWTGSSLGIFVDINPGMDRTGIAQNNTGEVLKIISAISEAGLEFRGIHYYDGHLGALDFAERRRVAHAGYDQLIQIVSEIEGKGFEVEVITAGTPCFPCSLDYAGFASSAFRHRVSPGTIVYCDATSLAQLPPEYGYRPAAVVLTRVVSHPTPGIITCDAGHKSVSADAGVPTCVVMGHTELTPQAPSEEHIPMAVASGSTHPAIGDFLYLVPRHVCPTVNNFDQAILTSRGRIKTLVEVTARGHEAPLLESPQLHQS